MESSRWRSVEFIAQDFRPFLTDEDFNAFVENAPAFQDDLQQLFEIYGRSSYDEYIESVKRVAERISRKISADIEWTFNEAIRIVEEMERKTVLERRRRSSDTDSAASLGAESIDWADAPGSPMSSSLMGSSQNKSSLATSSETNATSSIIDYSLEDFDTHQIRPSRVKRLEQRYEVYAESFIRTNLPWLLSAEHEEAKTAMKQAEEKAEYIMNEYGLDPNDLKKLTILALYDFAILCDDSWSMMPAHNYRNEDRIGSLKDLLIRIAELTALIVPTGISVRFLNYKADSSGEWDHLLGHEVIKRKLEKVDWSGLTRLGTMLKKKIIEPMVIQKMEQEEFKKPLIIVTITDGSPVCEPKDTFKNVVMECKTSEEIRKYGEAAVVFILARVGSDAGAELFLYDLRRSTDLKEWVYCPDQRLDENSAVFTRARIAGRAQGKDDYLKVLLDIFTAALRQQSKMRN
ncbi:hypothetical protein TWF506_008801 [Arthrobotrys conoides]|uniref:VWFA domain-containing protein n=1 Tax=Arthrobotrys conoides TaxID=74498 RepID=A0AAN8NDX4_9PEZI